MASAVSRHAVPIIPTESMADIAFLLLLFFLVATAIQTETGLPITLPPATTASGALGVPSLLMVLVGADGQVMAGGEPMPAEALRAEVARYAASVGQPRVALQAPRRTPYDAYIATLDAVLMGHRDAAVEPRLTLREPAR